MSRERSDSDKMKAALRIGPASALRQELQNVIDIAKKRPANMLYESSRVAVEEEGLRIYLTDKDKTEENHEHSVLLSVGRKQDISAFNGPKQIRGFGEGYSVPMEDLVKALGEKSGLEKEYAKMQKLAKAEELSEAAAVKVAKRKQPSPASGPMGAIEDGPPAIAMEPSPPMTPRGRPASAAKPIAAVADEALAVFAAERNKNRSSKTDSSPGSSGSSDSANPLSAASSPASSSLSAVGAAPKDAEKSGFFGRILGGSKKDKNKPPATSVGSAVAHKPVTFNVPKKSSGWRNFFGVTKEGTVTPAVSQVPLSVVSHRSDLSPRRGRGADEVLGVGPTSVQEDFDLFRTPTPPPIEAGIHSPSGMGQPLAVELGSIVSSEVVATPTPPSVAPTMGAAAYPTLSKRSAAPPAPPSSHGPVTAPAPAPVLPLSSGVPSPSPTSPLEVGGRATPDNTYDGAGLLGDPWPLSPARAAGSLELPPSSRSAASSPDTIQPARPLGASTASPSNPSLYYAYGGDITPRTSSSPSPSPSRAVTPEPTVAPAEEAAVLRSSPPSPPAPPLVRTPIAAPAPTFGHSDDGHTYGAIRGDSPRLPLPPSSGSVSVSVMPEPSTPTETPPPPLRTPVGAPVSELPASGPLSLSVTVPASAAPPPLPPRPPGWSAMPAPFFMPSAAGGSGSPLAVDGRSSPDIEPELEVFTRPGPMGAAAPAATGVLRPTASPPATPDFAALHLGHSAASASASPVGVVPSFVPPPPPAPPAPPAVPMGGGSAFTPRPGFRPPAPPVLPTVDEDRPALFTRHGAPILLAPVAPRPFEPGDLVRGDMYRTLAAPENTNFLKRNATITFGREHATFDQATGALTLRSISTMPDGKTDSIELRHMDGLSIQRGTGRVTVPVGELVAALDATLDVSRDNEQIMRRLNVPDALTARVAQLRRRTDAVLPSGTGHVRFADDDSADRGAGGGSRSPSPSPTQPLLADHDKAAEPSVPQPGRLQRAARAVGSRMGVVDSTEERTSKLALDSLSLSQAGESSLLNANKSDQRKLLKDLDEDQKVVAKKLYTAQDAELEAARRANAAKVKGIGDKNAAGIASATSQVGIMEANQSTVKKMGWGTALLYAGLTIFSGGTFGLLLLLGGGGMFASEMNDRNNTGRARANKGRLEGANTQEQAQATQAGNEALRETVEKQHEQRVGLRRAFGHEQRDPQRAVAQLDAVAEGLDLGKMYKGLKNCGQEAALSAAPTPDQKRAAAASKGME